MRRPDMLQPATLDDALTALTKRGAVPLAGATDLIPAMRAGEVAPRVLVNLKKIPALSGVRRRRGALRIGALTLVADLLRDALVAEGAPLLAEVARGFASPQIRNLATIGGNLCNAAPAADLALPLLVLDAHVEIAGPQGLREMPIDELFRGVNKTALRRAEILTAIVIPKRPVRSGAAHAKLGVRRAMDSPSSGRRLRFSSRQIRRSAARRESPWARWRRSPCGRARRRPCSKGRRWRTS